MSGGQSTRIPERLRAQTGHVEVVWALQRVLPHATPHSQRNGSLGVPQIARRSQALDPAVIRFYPTNAREGGPGVRPTGLLQTSDLLEALPERGVQNAVAKLAHEGGRARDKQCVLPVEEAARVMLGPLPTGMRLEQHRQHALRVESRSYLVARCGVGRRQPPLVPFALQPRDDVRKRLKAGCRRSSFSRLAARRRAAARTRLAMSRNPSSALALCGAIRDMTAISAAAKTSVSTAIVAARCP
mmetsp:Transcript_88115/g.247811  ORF Transcript_88115/g.247811 Transcript_88115/m.247811 type:complete len:243 (-) Transcript_88115:296-1024(-)